MKMIAYWMSKCTVQDIDGLVQDLDFSFSTRQNRPPESGQAQELHYEDIDTLLATF